MGGEAGRLLNWPVINPALKGRALWKIDVEHAERPLSPFDGCSRAALPPGAEPSDSHGFSELWRH
jgi:hypothetical protein